MNVEKKWAPDGANILLCNTFNFNITIFEVEGGGQNLQQQLEGG